MAQSERRLAAIMFTDIVGYTSLVQENESSALELLEEHNRILRPHFSEHGGTEIKTIGDSFLVEFSSALRAVRCAVEIQGVLNARNATVSESKKIQIRVGIHVGDVEHRDGDIFGDGVNIASRIEPLAEPGGICISEQVYAQIENKLEALFSDLGSQALKNIAKPVQVYQMILPWQKDKIDSAGGKTNRLDNLLKVGSVIAVSIIALIAIWFFIQSMSNPSKADLQTGRITSLAVLPFENLISDSESDHLGGGIAEELIYVLANVDGLTIPVSNSEFLEGRSIKEIGELLNAEAILQGSVQKSENQIRISIQLIRASDETYIWSERYDHEFKDIFRIQELIAEAVLKRLGFASDEKLVGTGTENTEAFNSYLMGRYHWNKRTEEGYHKAIDYFEQAVEIDPRYALAHVGLADTYSLMGNYAYLPQDEAFPLAKEHAESALEIDALSAEANVSLGFYEVTYERDYVKAEEYYVKAINLKPNYATAHHWYGTLLAYRLGRLEDGATQLQKAIKLDPLKPILHHALGLMLSDLGRREEAISQYRNAIEIDPGFPAANFALAGILAISGQWDEAEALFQRALQSNPNNDWLIGRYAQFLQSQGRKEESLDILNRALEENPTSHFLLASAGIHYYFSQDYDQAFAELNESHEIGETDFSHAYLSLVYFQQGILQAWMEELIQYFRFSGLLPETETALRQTYADYGVNGFIEAYINHSAEQTGKLCTNYAYVGALFHAINTDYDMAMNCLEEAYLLRGQVFDLISIAIEPLFDPLHAEPRFQELLAKMGLAD